ncbi:MAG: DUF1761 domain-containing protein [Candidatus Zixiibacteriota bacterium]
MAAISMNWWAVIVAAIAYMALGAVWYSPPLFAGAWMNGIGKTKEQIAAGFSPVTYVWALILSFLVAYGIARIYVWAKLATVWDGIVLGLLAGICFVLTSMGVNDLFEQRPRLLSAINILYHLVGFILIGVIIGAWH